MANPHVYYGSNVNNSKSTKSPNFIRTEDRHRMT